jgi:hypothetical protein
MSTSSGSTTTSNIERPNSDEAIRNRQNDKKK